MKTKTKTKTKLPVPYVGGSKPKFNPERRSWRGRSYTKGGRLVRELRYALITE
jgi:hypothetical protein